MLARLTILNVFVLLLLLVIYLIFRCHYPDSSSGKSPIPAVVFYNRIPKTGSTTFTNALAYDLAAANGFNAIHINVTRNRFAMSLADQASLARNITLWEEKHPSFYHGHVAFIDFTRFGLPNPVYINLVREPLDRFLSYYYFLQYGDDYRVGLKRSRAGRNETFDDCWRRRGRDCDLRQMWLQIPYFCGTMSFCGEPGNAQALKTAKWNMRHRYMLVGVTERMEETVKLLEHLLPTFFAGALQHFNSLDGGWGMMGEVTGVQPSVSARRSHLRHTLVKVLPAPDTIAEVKLSPIYRMEAEFYEAVMAEFNTTMRRATDTSGDILKDQFHYEKIKP